MSVMQDTGKAVSMDFKKAGDLIYIVGVTFNELAVPNISRAWDISGTMPQSKPRAG